MANEEIRDKKDLQAQINEGLREQNNLTQQYATLLQAQKDSSKNITDDMKDRATVLATLVQNNNKNLSLDQRISNLKSKQSEIEETLSKSRTKAGKFQKGFSAAKIKSLQTDKAALDVQIESLEIQDSFKKGLSEVDSAFGGIGASIGSFLTNPITIATAALLTFNATQQAIGDQFGVIGVTEFRDELAGANAQFTSLGLSAEEAQVATSNLANEFGLGVSESTKLSENVSRLAVSTGASLTDTTKLIGLFTQTQNLTGDQAANLLASTTSLANANNVAPDKVLADVAQSSEFFAQFADKGGENILRAAVQARKLGINLQSVEKITSGLLDFQSSLNAENEASVLIGRKLNFQKARELALANDIEGATAAVVEQLGSAEEFNRLNAIQRKALADAAGVEVGELAKIVNKEKEALTLQGALSKTEIKPIPEEVLTATASLINNLQSIGVTLAETLGPTLDFIVGTFGGLVEVIDSTIGMGPALLGLFVAIKGKAMLAAAANIYNAIAGFFSAAAAGSATTLGFGTPVLVGLATAAVASMIGALSAAPAGDIISPAKGKTMVSPKEGGLFELSKNDDLMAAPGLAGAIGGGTGGGGRVDTSRLEALQSETTQKLERVAAVLEGALSGPKPALARAMGAATGDAVEGMA
jgi:hypothetical protein